MRFNQLSGLILLSVSAAMACASETEDGAADLSGAGGTVDGAGGTVDGAGGTVDGAGGTTVGAGGTTVGAGGTTVGTKTPCVAGTVVATSTPNVLVWELQPGNAATEETSTAAGPIEVTTTEGPAEPYISAILSQWAESGRECIDVSAFTGVQFDIASTATAPLYFKIGVSAADPSGHCPTPETMGNECYANPAKIITPGAGVKVPFSDLAPAGWGVNAPFNDKQVISLIWASTDKTGGKVITVSNVSFYTD